MSPTAPVSNHAAKGSRRAVQVASLAELFTQRVFNAGRNELRNVSAQPRDFLHKLGCDRLMLGIGHHEHRLDGGVEHTFGQIFGDVKYTIPNVYCETFESSLNTISSGWS